MKTSFTINEMKKYIKQFGYTNEILAALESDSRKGAEVLLNRYQKQVIEEEKQKQSYINKQQYERKLYQENCSMIAGIDEAGRGPLAGPVIAAAVILPHDFYLSGLDDSKQLPPDKRDAYFDVIKQHAVRYGIGIVHSEVIDRINIFQATKQAMYQAITSMEAKIDHILIDAVELENLPCPSTSIIKGDQKSVTIAAASILAKVTRDRWMKELSRKYPQYEFDKNMGYGTKKHIDALEKYGPSPCHRYSFAPVRANIIK